MDGVLVKIYYYIGAESGLHSHATHIQIMVASTVTNFLMNPWHLARPSIVVATVIYISGYMFSSAQLCSY